MRVLLACECSGVVREAFKARGHDAWSCDIQDTEIPGQHYKTDLFNVINDNWDLMIAFPPCTYLSHVGNRWLKQEGRLEKRKEGVEFFKSVYDAPIAKICVENPLGCMSTILRKPDQIIHPYYFGDPQLKRTCLWLKNLPKLVYPKENLDNKPAPMYYLKTTSRPVYYVEGLKGMSTKERQKARSRFWPGIANAMAQQWG